MIFYPIQTLVNSGIEDILVVTGGPHAGDFLNVLRNGQEFGVRRFFYAFQEKEGQLGWSKLQGFWSDAGTFDSLLEVNNYWAKIRK